MAGVGEMARNGIVLNPFLGLRFKAAATIEATAPTAELSTRLVTPITNKPVTEKMIAAASMFSVKLSDNPTLMQMLVDLDDAARRANARKWGRIPILDDNKYPKHVIHRSTVNEFLTNFIAGRDSFV